METRAGHGNKRQRSLPPLTHPTPGFSLVCRSQGEGWQVSRKINFHHRLHLLGSSGSRELKKIRVTLIFLTHSIIFKHSKAIEKRKIRGEGAYKKHVDYLGGKKPNLWEAVLKLSVDLEALWWTCFTLLLWATASPQKQSLWLFLSLPNRKLQMLRAQGVSRQSPQGGQVGWYMHT